ncbi:MAG: hypothetical protein ACXQT3_02845 [Methermicoccaceae archaeon]
MAYTTSAEVIALTGSSLSSATVDSIIAIADDEIDARLEREGLSITGSTPAQIAVASRYLSSALVLERQRADGTLPDSVRVGDMQVAPKIEETITRYRTLAQYSVQSYISAQRGEDYYTAFERVEIDWSGKP